jgi:internalin A
MNPRLPRAMLLAVALLTLAAARTWATNPPDKNLEAALRAVLHEPQKELTDEHYNRVYVLDAVGKGIKDLTGLEKCKNLRSLRLTKNQISDVKPLAGLIELQSLDLADNQISDVKPLAGLTNLQYLELSNNQISDVEPLRGLTGLNALYLSGNKISNIAPLEGLTKLWSLHLAKNGLQDIGPLTALSRLSTLGLNDNQIRTVAPLAHLTELNMVLLERNRITDVKPLVAAAAKDAAGPMRFAPFLQLYLAGNPLSADARARDLPALQKVGVRVFGMEANGK